MYLPPLFAGFVFLSLSLRSLLCPPPKCPSCKSKGYSEITPFANNFLHYSRVGLTVRIRGLPLGTLSPLYVRSSMRLSDYHRRLCLVTKVSYGTCIPSGDYSTIHTSQFEVGTDATPLVTMSSAFSLAAAWVWSIYCTIFQELLTTQNMKLKEALDTNRFLELMSMSWADMKEMDDYEILELRKEIKGWLALFNRPDLPFTEKFILTSKGKLAALNGMLMKFRVAA